MSDEEKYWELDKYCCGRSCGNCVLSGRLCSEAFNTYEDKYGYAVYDSAAVAAAYNALVDAGFAEPEPDDEYVGEFDLIALIE